MTSLVRNYIIKVSKNIELPYFINGSYMIFLINMAEKAENKY